MKFRDFSVTLVSSILLTPVLLLCLQVSDAQVMQSGSYRIQSDSINFGGGLSTSTNYGVESTGGEIATGESTSTSYSLKAGYQQMVNNFISMSAPGNVTMSPSIGGVTGGTANGSTTVTVTTDSGAGYVLSISASQSPAMTKGGDSIADYVPGGDPDYNFTTGASDSHFGYSPEGQNVVTRFKDNGAACNTGALETTLSCWDGLDTALEQISRASSANTPNGATTTINFRVGVGSGVAQAPGTYTATTTLTALSL
ncbi:MAG: hypothetical protein WAW13_00755 [Minisyncoccia bacterium]